MICRALFPRILRSLFARIAAFKEYSIFFEDHADGVYCVVRTWDEIELQETCVRVDSFGQQVPRAEFSSLSRVIDCVITSQLPLSINGGSSSLLRVLSDNRIDGRQFVVHKDITVDLFLQCSLEVYEQIFGMLEETTMVDFLMLRLRGAYCLNLWFWGRVCLGVSIRSYFHSKPKPLLMILEISFNA